MKNLRRRSRSTSGILLLCSLVSLALTASIGVNPPAAQAADPHLMAASSHPPANTETSSRGALVIKRSDDRKSFTVRVGRIVRLNLGDGLVWIVPPQSSGVLHPLGKLDGSAKFRAQSVGATVLRAYGHMRARPGQATAMFVILFQVTIQVVR